MRYRAVPKLDSAISALTLRVDDTLPREVRAPLVYAAFEAGINAFDIGGVDPTVLDDIAPALRSVDRRLAFVSVRLGAARNRAGERVRDFTAERLVRVVEACAARLGIGYLDVALLDDPGESELSLRALAALKVVREKGRVRMLGVSGDCAATDAYVANGAFDVLMTPYSLTSSWHTRHRLKAAADVDMAVLACDYFPEALQSRPTVLKAAGGLLSRLMGRSGQGPAADPTGYGFLETTSGWSAEELCLSYALTEPGLASAVIAPQSPDALAALAVIADRELPPSLPAQIEMARFARSDAA